MIWKRAVALLFALSLVHLGCGGDGGDGGTDVTDDAALDVEGDVAPTDTDVATGDDGASGDTDRTDVGVDRTLSCFVVTRGGEVALDGPVTLAAADEVDDYAADPGLQFDVRVAFEGASPDSRARLALDDAEVAALDVAPDASGAGEATFAAVTVPHAPEGLAARVDLVSSEGAVYATCSGSLLVDLGPCPVTLEPAADACLTSDGDMAPGFQQTFTVRSEGGGCDSASLLYQIGGTPIQLPAIELDPAGAAAFPVTLFPSAAGLNNEGVLVTATVADTTNPGREAQSTPRVYTVDSAAPRVEIDAPAGTTVTVEDDADDDPTNGLQLVVAGRAPGLVPGDGMALSLSVDGAVERTTEVATDGGFAFAAVSFTQPETVQLEVAAVDSCGQRGEWTATVDVFPVLPELAILTPADGGALWSKDDGDGETALTYEATFTVQAAGIEEGTTLTARCRRDTAGAPQMVVGELTVADPSEDGQYDVPVALRVDLQGNEQVCTVSTSGANAATSAPVTLWVALPAPRLTLLTPADETTLGTDAVVVTGTAENLSGQSLQLHLDDEAGVPVVVTIGATPILGGTFSGTIPFEQAGQPIPDGRYRVWVDATDTLGNVASEQAESDVDAWIVLDRTAPTVSFEFPTPDGLNPSTDPAAADSDPESPGYQSNVIVRIEGEADAAGIEICLQQNGADVGCMTLTAGEDGAGFAHVTFQPGANTLVATATDPVGNVGTTGPYPVDLVFDAPRVVFDAPPAGFVTADATVDVVLRVTADAGALDGATVELYVNGDRHDATPDALGGGRYGFDAVPLVPGPNELEGIAWVGDGAQGASGPHTVTYKVDGPTLAFADLSDGQAVNLATAACDPGLTDCVLTVALTATNLEDGAAASLTVDCGDGPAAFEASAADDAVAFPGITLPDGATCTLSARATDIVGAEATAGPITVTVDRTAPVIGPIGLPDVLQAAADEDLDAPGMQVSLTLDVSGAEAGQALAVRAENSEGVAFDYEVILDADLPDGAPTPVAVGLVTLPEDFVEVTADIADAAGNPADTARQSVFVNSEVPDVRLLLPTRVPNDPCATNDDCATGGVCGADGCGTPWGAATTFEVQVGLQGVALSEDALRICSDHPDLAAAPACANGGGAFHELVRADVTGEVSTVSVETLIPEGFQTIIAEAEALPGSDDWIATIDNPIDIYRRRFLYVDTVAPTLASLTSPSDTDAPTDVLNAAEQSAPGRVYRMRVASSEDGVATLRVNGMADGVVALEGGVGEADVTLVEGSNTVQVRLTDRVGNVSALGPDPAYAPFVDTVLPTLSFVTPDRSPLLAGDGRDVVLQSDAIGRTVTLFDGDPPVEVATAEVAPDGRATFPHASFGVLSDGAHQLTAAVADDAGNLRTAATSPAVVEVDTAPPTLSVRLPESGRVFTDDDDAGPAMGGFQLLVRFTPTGAATWSLDLASDCDTAFENCDAPVAKGNGSAAGGSEIGLTMTVPVTGATSYHVLSVQARDTLGNTVREDVPFSLQLTSCIVSVAGLPGSGVYNNLACVADPGRDCDTVDDAVTVSFSMSCAGTDAVALYKDEVEFARTTDLGVDNTAAFDVTFAHGESFELSAKALAGETPVGDSGGLPVLVDLHDPVPTFVATVVDGFATAAPGDRPLYGIADDQQPGSPDTAEIHVQLTATDDVGLAGGRVLSFYRTTDGVSEPLVPSNVSLPLPITTEPWSVDLKNLSLPHGGPHVLRIAVADRAGNSATTAIVPTVDVIAPAAVALDAIADVDVNPRRPSIDLGWTAVADDGAAGDPATGYDVRFSNLPITTDVQFESACPADELVGGLPYPTPGAPGAAESFTLDGPDARSPVDPCRFLTSLTPQTWHVAVRAIDDAGNASPLGAASTQSTAAVQLRTAAVTHQDIALDPANEGDIDYWVWPVGDLDGDGTEDMAFGGFWASAICVLYGHADDAAGTFEDYLMDGLTGPHHVCVADGALTYFGFTTAGPIDVNGDGIHDLVVGSGSRFPAWPADETVRVFLGRDGAPIAATPNVTIVGMETFQFTGLHVASAGNFTGDVNGVNPVEDIIVASDFEGPAGAETGAVYVIPGSAAWTAATSLTIDVSDPADRAANDVGRIALQGAVPIFDGGSYVPPLFGYRVAGAGDILPDDGETQYDDVLVAQRIHKRNVYLIKGRPLTGGAEILVTDDATVPSPPTGEDAQLVRLQPEFAVSASNFGDTLIGGVDLDGRGTPDVVITHPINAPGNNIHVFWGEELPSRMGVITTRVAVTGSVGADVALGSRGVIIPGNHQRPALIGDFDDDGGTVDLVYGVKGVSDFGEVFLRLNLGLPAVDGRRGVFPFEDLVFDDPTGAGSLCFGSSLAGPGDVNGDGWPDLLVGGGGCGTAWLIY